MTIVVNSNFTSIQSIIDKATRKEKKNVSAKNGVETELDGHANM